MELTVNVDAENFTELFVSWPPPKQLSFLAKLLTNPQMLNRAHTAIKLFNNVYHKNKDAMIGQGAFNNYELINVLVRKYLALNPVDSKHGGIDKLKVFVLTDTVLMLGMLAREDGARTTIIQLRTVESIISLLRNFNSQKALLESCLFALGNISLHVEGKDLITAAGGIELIIKLISDNLEFPNVLERSCFTLGNLAYHDSCKASIMSHRGIREVMQITRRHTQIGSLFLEVCFFLSNMSVIPEGREIIISEGGVDFIVSAMKAHSGVAELLELGCGALHNISIDVEGKKKVLTSSCLEVMVNGISSHLDSQSFLIEALGSLSSLFLETREEQTQLIKSGAIKFLVEILSRNATARLSLLSFGILNHLSSYCNSTYQVVPPISSLKELSARVVKNSDLILLKSNMTKLPVDLLLYIDAFPNSTCDHCRKHFLENFYEIIVPKSYQSYPLGKLPAYYRLCSEYCMESVQAIAKSEKIEAMGNEVQLTH